MKRSWFFQKSFFVTLLAFVLLMHFLLLFIRYQRHRDLSSNPETASLQIRLIEERNIKNQIVQSEDPNQKKKPVDEAFLSDKNRTFDRQTRARKVDQFRPGEAQGKNQKLSLSDLSPFSRGHHPLQTAARQQHSSSAKKQPVSASNDFVKDVPLGDLTYLNTVEYKYYGFFHRIRQKLEQFWGRSIQEKAQDLFKEGRRLASEENLITGLIVVLNPQGKIIHIQIIGSSGVKELDEAAVEAFNQAGPFPHPPKGLIHQGRVEIAWGFVVDT